MRLVQRNAQPTSAPCALPNPGSWLLASQLPNEVSAHSWVYWSKHEYRTCFHFKKAFEVNVLIFGHDNSSTLSVSFMKLDRTWTSRPCLRMSGSHKIVIQDTTTGRCHDQTIIYLWISCPQCTHSSADLGCVQKEKNKGYHFNYDICFPFLHTTAPGQVAVFHDPVTVCRVKKHLHSP